MSASLSSQHATTPPLSSVGKHLRNGRPHSAEPSSKMKNKPEKSPKGQSKGIMKKIFKMGKAKENGVVPVRPSCFDDDFVRRPESPDSPSRGPVPSTTGAKAGKGKEDRSYGLWRPKGKCEWESQSGRTLTLKPVEMTELSQIELCAFQRVAITQLQAMNLPVSHAIIAAAKKGRLSFNSFNKRRISTGNDQAVGMFGQPIDKVATDRASSSSGAETPVASGSRSSSLQPPSSPTSSDTIFLDTEPNPTALLLEALLKTDRATAPPSPKTQRQLALRPSEPRVPPIVRKAIELLDEKAVKTEGLFRISGSKARIHDIKLKFDRGEDVDLSDANPHDIAALFKDFFRSLPEPLMTRELFGPILGTRKLTSAAQKRDALRLFCLLLPQANRDTLQALLQFLSRVALHSDGIILIDGTEETGNRMTEKNLGLIMGPNILHKERKTVGVKQDYQVIKQDQEELEAVCNVMEDLIRMHTSIFTIPAVLYDQAIRTLQSTDPEAVDTLLKRKCADQGLEGYRRVTPGNTPTSTLRLVVPPGSSPSWRRSRSLSDTEKTLDDAIRELDNLQVNINDDLEVALRHRHYSSNDSAMGESEPVMSPAPSAGGSEPSTLSRARDIPRNRSDSAFSNNTSPTDSSNEGMSASDVLSLESTPSFVHQRNASTLSSASEPERQRREVGGPTSLDSARPHPTSDSVSLPTFSPEREIDRDLSLLPHERSVSDIASITTSSKHHTSTATPSSSKAAGNQKRKKWKLRTMPSVTSSGTFSPSRSPVLTSRGQWKSTDALNEGSSDDKSNPISGSSHSHSTEHLPSVVVGSGTSSMALQGAVI